MASYQQDFLGKGKTPPTAAQSYSLLKRYESSPICINAQIAWQYFNGENKTISELRRMYWKDGTKDETTGKVSAGGFTDNPYVANNKIGFGFFRDMVTQKVDTLFREIPSINTEYKLDDKFIKRYGFALKVAGERASAQGFAFLLLDRNSNIQVFSSDRAVAFYDDYTGEMKALIRWWYMENLNAYSTMYWEIYDEEGVATYRNRPHLSQVGEKVPYKFNRRTSRLTDEIEPISVGLPIVEFRNTYDKRSDFSTNIRSKIDIIDIVQSGFANNIEDFSDVYWAIKDNGSLSGEYYEDFVANINRTRKVFGEAIDVKQVQIPTEARSKFVEIMKDDLIRDGGVVDMKALTNGNLTATAIHAARAGLETRVSAFEWVAYEAATRLIEIYQTMNGVQFDFDVTFNKYTINNVTETIQNAVLLYGKVSEDTFLNMLKSADIISDVEEEKEKMADETFSKYGAGGGINDDDTAQ